MDKPCLNCKKVEHPEDCDLKQCRAWMKWWLESWDKIHNYYRLIKGDKNELP